MQTLIFAIPEDMQLVMFLWAVGALTAVVATLAVRWPRRRGATPHGENWTRVDIVLLDRHLSTIDRLAGGVHLRMGGVVTREGIIEALVDLTDQFGGLGFDEVVDRLVKVIEYRRKADAAKYRWS